MSKPFLSPQRCGNFWLLFTVSATINLFFFGIAASEIIPGQMVSWTDFSHITCISVSSEYAYFGTTEGILRYNCYEKRWQEPITVSDGLPGRIIQRIAVPLDDGWITVETEEGIYTYQFGANYWYLDTEFPLAFERDSRPRYPLPDLFMPFGYRISPEGVISDNLFREWQVTAWLDDQYQSILIGSWGLGTLRADNRDLTAELIPCGLLQKRTDAIYMEGDSIWLAGNPGQYADYENNRFGATLYDRNSQQFTYFEPRFIPGFDSEAIYDIDGDGKHIYFAGKHGMTVYPRTGKNILTLARGDGLPDRQATALAAAGDSVWVGTARGLALYDPAADTVHVISRRIFGKLFITDLLLLNDRLFIGTDQGAFYVGIGTKTIGRLREPESWHLSDSAKDPFSVLDGEIRHLFVYDSLLYVSADRGLAVIDLKTEKIVGEPEITEPVYACAANGKYVVAALEDALLLIDLETGKRRRFTEADGLLSTRISTIVPENDYLWLGSDEGLTRFQWVNPKRVD